MRLFLFVSLLAAVPLAAIAYNDGPPPGHTGGFGEPTCAACHDDNRVNDAGGALQLEGVPQSYTPGRSYAITVALRRDGLQRAGFQIASRFSDGPSAGKQAGTWSVDADLVQATTGTDVVYVQQTRRGNVVKPAGIAEWHFEWQAPGAPQSPIAFHVAANASNRDDSALGDFIYVASETSEPTAPKVAAGPPHSSSAIACPSVPDDFCIR